MNTLKIGIEKAAKGLLGFPSKESKSDNQLLVFSDKMRYNSIKRGDLLMEKKYTAQDVLEIIENLENSERWNLLDKMYDKYFNSGSVPKNEEEITEY